MKMGLCLANSAAWIRAGVCLVKGVDAIHN